MCPAFAVAATRFCRSVGIRHWAFASRASLRASSRFSCHVAMPPCRAAPLPRRSSMTASPSPCWYALQPSRASAPIRSRAQARGRYGRKTDENSRLFIQIFSHGLTGTNEEHAILATSLARCGFAVACARAPNNYMLHVTRVTVYAACRASRCMIRGDVLRCMIHATWMPCACHVSCAMQYATICAVVLCATSRRECYTPTYPAVS